MKKTFVLRLGILFSVVLLTHNISAQLIPDSNTFQRQGGIEVSLPDLNYLDKVLAHPDIVLDHGCQHNRPMLYMGAEGYAFLVASTIPHTYHPRQPSKIIMKGPEDILSLRKGRNCMEEMDFYPTYEAYVAMMNNFADTYPDICRVFSIGTLSSGRDILVAQIGDNPDVDDIEPNFLYTSSMHGDEIAGYPMMLQLIDLLTCEYESNPSIKNLVDNINIYINPLANPDGTYTDDNSTVQGATRRNANFVDLHRNFPDPDDGPNPDNRPYQEETLAFMEFAADYNIHMSCNFHGGEEVISYPWDTYNHDPADVDWWLRLSREYADSCQANGPMGYMTRFDNGITNGFGWYEVQGGRQDHMIYFHRGREFTIELSRNKILGVDRLPDYWNGNKAALLNYMEESLYGLHGIITDCETGQPVKAEIRIPDHDIDNSSVFSDSLHGDFYRYLEEGNYNVQIIAENYDTLNLNVDISNKQRTSLEEIEICVGFTSTAELLDELKILQTRDQITISGSNTLPSSFNLLDISGQQLATSQDNRLTLPSAIAPGVYIIQYIFENNTFNRKIYIP